MWTQQTIIEYLKAVASHDASSKSGFDGPPDSDLGWFYFELPVASQLYHGFPGYLELVSQSMTLLYFTRDINLTYHALRVNEFHTLCFLFQLAFSD